MTHMFNRILVFPHKHRLARVIRTRGGKEGFLPVSKVLFDTHLDRNMPFRAIVPFFLDLCYTVDKVKVETIGHSAPTDVSNAIQTAIGHEIVKNVSWTYADIEWLEEGIKTFQSSPGNMDTWGAAKLVVLMNSMVHMYRTRGFASMSLALFPPALVAEMESGYNSKEAELAELMSHLVELRRYGVKSSFTRQGFLPEQNGAWVMWDYRDIARELGTSRRDCIAMLAFANDANQIKDLRMEAVRHEKADHIGLRTPFPCAFMWHMQTDGELDLSAGNGSLPVREVFQKNGNDVLYQAFREQLIGHLYDLIVPVAKLATLPTARGVKKSVVQKIQELLGRRQMDPVAELILPRIKLLENHSEVARAAEEEIEKSAEETARRTKRRHEVVDFIRPLPPGHRPSPMARKLAREAFGIELADNETYVRSHKRGSGEEITAHSVRKMR